LLDEQTTRPATSIARGRPLRPAIERKVVVLPQPEGPLQAEQAALGT
jgi:hypothetical protein